MQPSGDYLYKYSSTARLDWLEGILLQHRLYFPNPKELNDPLEARPTLRSTDKGGLFRLIAGSFALDNARMDPKLLAQEIKNIQHMVLRFPLADLDASMERLFWKALSSHRIYSMTKRSDNSHLWERYAAGHSGYCLEFRNEGWPFLLAREVVYQDTITIDPTERTEHHAGFLFHKTTGWAPEEEVRLVLFPRGQPANVNFEPALLKRIILGSRMSRADRDAIQSIVSRRSPALTVSDE